MFVFTNFYVIKLGKGSIADIITEVAADTGDDTFIWTLSEISLADPLGVNIPHITHNGTFEIPCMVRVHSVQPDVGLTCYALMQNHSNSFNSPTDIRYQIVDGESEILEAGDKIPIHANLIIYNTLGQEVRTLVDEPQKTGYYTATWDGKDGQGNTMPSGIYFYRLFESGRRWSETKKMLLLR